MRKITEVYIKFVGGGHTNRGRPSEAEFGSVSGGEGGPGYALTIRAWSRLRKETACYGSGLDRERGA